MAEVESEVSCGRYMVKERSGRKKKKEKKEKDKKRHEFSFLRKSRFTFVDPT